MEEFKCRFCGKVLENMRCMSGHLQGPKNKECLEKYLKEQEIINSGFNVNSKFYMDCKICGEIFTPRGKHLQKVHNISPQQYYDEYIHEVEKYCTNCGKEKRFLGLYKGGYCITDWCGTCIIKHKHKTSNEKYIKEQKLNYKISKREKAINNSKILYPNTKYICPYCSQHLKHEQAFTNHLKRTHNISILEYNLEFNKKEAYCIKCHKEIEFDYNCYDPKLILCCKNYKEAAIKREEEFKNIIEENGFSKKHNISKRAGIKTSIKLKAKIASGEWTPCVTNSWANSRVKIEINGFEKGYRSTWDAVFQILNPITEYEKLRVQYIGLDNEYHTYIVDFIDEINKVVYEIKPNNLKSNELNIIKEEALIDWCSQNDYEFISISNNWFKEHANKIDYSLYSGKLLKGMKQFL